MAVIFENIGGLCYILGMEWRMIRGVFCCVLLLFWSQTLFSSTISLEELVNPDSIQLGGGQVYITDGSSVYIYNDDFSLKKKFGKKGEGPGEFKINPAGVVKLKVQQYSGGLIINNLSRVSFFSDQGIYKNQVDVATGGNFQLLGNHYVGFSSYNQDKILYLSVNLYDENFKKIKKIHSQEYYVQVHKKFDLMLLGSGNKSRAYYQVYGNLLFIRELKGSICVYDHDGNHKYDIDPVYEKVEITESQKEEIFKDIYVLYTGRAIRRVIKEKGIFPQHFPIGFFKISDDKIYFPTYRQKDGKTLFLVYSIPGKKIKEIYLPLKYQSLLLPYPFTIHKETLYQLHDNEEEECWEVIISKVD